MSLSTSTYANFADLFPTKLSFCVFVGYITLFINQGLLVKASQTTTNDYNYNIVTVVMMTEVLKLVISICLYCKDNPLSQLVIDVVQSWRVLLLYLIPAFLYCLYNNLSFTMLRRFDPTTYYLLLQLRVVITGVLFQFIFKKKLSGKQWQSLVLLTFGCMLKQVNFGDMDKPKTFSLDFFDVNAVFLFIQIICSCLAGVYNEYLLKNQGAQVNIFVQNIYMYLDSIFCNVFLMILQGDVSAIFTTNGLSQLTNIIVVLIMLNNAVVGIVTSFFLRVLNSIVKTFASAIELIFTAILCYLLFGIPIYWNTVASIAIVSAAVILYAKNPIQTSKVELETVVTTNPPRQLPV